MRLAILSGWKTSRESGFSPIETNLIARDLAHREGTAATRVTVELGHDDAVEVHALSKLADDVDDVLTGHGIDYHEDLVGLDGRLNVHRLLHHLLVDLQAAGGVDDDDVVEMVDRLLDGAPRHGNRVLAVATEHGDGNLVAQRLQLVCRGGAVGVACRKQGAVTLSLQQVGQLGCSSGLAGALQAHEHDHVGCAVLGQDELGLGGAQQLGELVQDDHDHVLRRREGVQDLGGHALLLARGDERLHHAVVDVGLEQGHADLAHGRVDVVLGQAALAAELVEGALEAVGQAVEHDELLPLSVTHERA